MQTVTLSEFCRIVKKVLKEKKGKLSLVHMGENQGTCVDTGKQHGRIPRYMGNGMYEKCGSELERPYPSPKGKEKAYKFDFLGMHHRRMTTETSKGQLYKETYQYPSGKAMKKMKAEIKKNVNSRSLLVAKEEDLIKNLNPKITGWKNYYSTQTNEKWMQALDWYIICTFTRWYNKKH